MVLPLAVYIVPPLCTGGTEWIVAPRHMSNAELVRRVFIKVNVLNGVFPCSIMFGASYTSVFVKLMCLLPVVYSGD